MTEPQTSEAATEIRNVVIGTAGHIDHGKSTLVQTLTGKNPTRLSEELERGMTIDLGFSNFVYQGKYRIGMIDVPGHEKFVKNMVAGASGVDIVLLVIAADDGVMPQTREHIEILTLLGIQRGVIALNKADLVDADTLELAAEDARDAVKGTFLESAPVVPVSALTRQGLDALWKALGGAIEATKPKDTQGAFRMPVQRVFSAKGQGAVLTGIPVSGRVRLGDNVVILPGEQKGKVRGIQAYHAAIEEARAGHSTALNLAGVDHTACQRGYTVAEPGVFSPSRHFSVRLRLLEKAPRTLKHRSEVKFHVGTSEIVATLFLLDRQSVEPGQTCDCELILEEPVVAGMGDRFILRLPSPAITLGGGQVIRGERDQLPRSDAALMQRLSAWATAADNPVLRVELAIEDAGPAGIDRQRLAQATELRAGALAPLVEQVLAKGAVEEFGPSRALIHRDARARARAVLVSIIDRFHDNNKAQLGPKAASVQAQMGLDGRTFASVVEAAVSAGQVEIRGELLGLPGRGGVLSADEKKIVERIAVQLEESMLNPPTLKELAKAAGQNETTTQNAIDYLVGSGRARVLHDGVLFSTKALEFARKGITDFLKAKGEAAAKDFKEVLPTSRKFLIPLLEYMDSQGVTRNVNGTRTLKPEA
ncbi:MAG: Selenocysteine-specific elongation factor [Planctomycetes bacterium]|nr:Selenocysteine-specific elongation factor [Planctomycetota bacterium]